MCVVAGREPAGRDAVSMRDNTVCCDNGREISLPSSMFLNNFANLEEDFVITIFSEFCIPIASGAADASKLEILLVAFKQFCL